MGFAKFTSLGSDDSNRTEIKEDLSFCFTAGSLQLSNFYS